MSLVLEASKNMMAAQASGTAGFSVPWPEERKQCSAAYSVGSAVIITKVISKSYEKVVQLVGFVQVTVHWPGFSPDVTHPFCAESFASKPACRVRISTIWVTLTVWFVLTAKLFRLRRVT
ncbi:hypothetical protein [Pseudomonas sp. NFACC02]|uniref:hypothetical protein n=1 Tax=Pseudomonas sp. NFACC02 TaxID=1566250 RepID=UPI001113EA4B|nr:hypothetical protein [Pseudomonas sp. NFACC02]